MGIVDLNNILRVRAMKTLRAEETLLTQTASMVEDPFLRKHYQSKAQDMNLARAVLLDVGGITQDMRQAAAIIEISLKAADTAADALTLQRNLQRVIDCWPRVSKLFDVEVQRGT